MQQQITLKLSVEKAFEYQKALLAVLSRIQVGECDPFIKEHVKLVYELLGQLNTPQFQIQQLGRIETSVRQGMYADDRGLTGN